MKIKQISTEGTFYLSNHLLILQYCTEYSFINISELIFSIIAEKQNLLGIGISLYSFLVFILNIYI